MMNCEQCNRREGEILTQDEHGDTLLLCTKCHDRFIENDEEE